MAKCDKCGNDYDKSFRVEIGGASYVFDSFECAISMVAPHCSHCDCVIIGHGVQAGDKVYCCANCAKSAGEQNLRDRV
ncbi:MAG: hypothetical protein ACM3VS_01420 [Candidatus Dadabacteria bacterium]